MVIVLERMIGGNLKNGKFLYNEFHVNFTKDFSEQLESLKEDLLQVEFDEYLVDVGWYPEYDPQGKFIVQLIKKGIGIILYTKA